MGAASQPRSRTSDVLRELAEQCRSQPATLRTLTERLGDRTFGCLLIVVAALGLVPLISIAGGLLVTLLGLQMAIGRSDPWLPARVLDHVLPAPGTAVALEAMALRAERLERSIRPRWQFAEAPIVDRMNGLLIAVLGLVVMLPLPFANLAPVLVVVIMALGLLERDGALQMLAMTVGLGLLAGLFLLATSGAVGDLFRLT